MQMYSMTTLFSIEKTFLFCPFFCDKISSVEIVVIPVRDYRMARHGNAIDLKEPTTFVNIVCINKNLNFILKCTSYTLV